MPGYFYTARRFVFMNFVKGMVTGLLVGSAVTMLADPISDRQRHKMQKKTEGIFKNIGGAIDNALDMFK